MKREIHITLEEGKSNKAQGNCFEDLIRKLISIHQYEVRGNINLTGMEIDLVAEHKYNKETLYVECKAKQKVKSDELSKFIFNVTHKRIDKGYFFRTQELESQAGGMLSEIRSDDRYNNLTFFEPAEIIQMLLDAKMIYEPSSEISQLSISKQILAVTYFGDFLIYLIHDHNAIPTKCVIVNANSNSKNISKEHSDLLKSRIPEIGNLELIQLTKAARLSETKSQAKIESLETISEVQESENWYDYLPASSSKKHFVGRDEIRTQILGFFKKVQSKSTNKRVFYLNGKSGWGKSSLVLEIKGRCRNKHYKKKFYTIAIDTRSAISDNFAALALKKLIESAIQDNFISKDLFLDNIKFNSTVDLLSSESIQKLLQKLEIENKCLILIFDQFEDVFRKKDFFKTFYKLLSDVTDKRPNLIVGFSWKSDFFIQGGDPAYHIWQQAKEQALEFSIGEFGEREIDGVIKQLEDTIGKLNVSIKNRIKESSQGLPWLTKKLCIHILDQINSGTAKEDLIESNLNISELFKNDEERVDADELKALRLIAKRAYDGNFFDETEVGELIHADVISSLLHKRLIIRSGANYNIYWDIYRDYLVTGLIPKIGESYLIRQGVNLCLEVFLLFKEDERISIETLHDRHPKRIGLETLNNILIELRNLGMVQKQDENYFVSSDLNITKNNFIKFVTDKFQNYTPYLSLKSLNSAKITKTDVIQVLKKIFKQEYQDNTWDTYAKTLINWFLMSNLELKQRLIEPKKGRGDGVQKLTKVEIENSIPRSSLKEIIELIPILVDNTAISSKYFRDLFLIGLIDENRNLTDFGLKVMSEADDDKRVDLLKSKVIKLPKMLHLSKRRSDSPKITAKKLIESEPDDFFDGTKETSKVIYATKALTWIK